MIVALLAASPAVSSANSLGARIQNLGQKLRTDRSYKIRLLAARKLAQLSTGAAHANPKVIHALMLGLEDPNPLVRAMSARGLGVHHAYDASAVLKQLARHDPARAVRQQSRRASKTLESRPKIAPPEPQPPAFGITLGTVSVLDGPLLARGQAEALRIRLSRVVRDRIRAHQRTAPPRSPALRIDMRVERQRGKRSEVRFEVRVVLLELPKAHLRHTAKAVAHADPKGRKVSALHERVALEAVHRAMDDVFATAIASR